jgi:hypothetical protein
MSRPAPDLVTVCKFLEFLTSSLDTTCSRFTVFLGIIFSSTIRQSSRE